MFIEIPLHPFIIPDEQIIKKLEEKVAEGDLFIFYNLETAVRQEHMLCYGWVNYVKEIKDEFATLVLFGCRVLEDTDKLLAVNYKDEKIINLYLV
jgi:hypothetical protein